MYKNINKKMSESIETILINIVRDSNSHMDKINNSVLSNNKLLQTLIEKVSKVEEENKYLREKMEILVGDNKYLREKMEDTHKNVDELSNTNKVLFEKIVSLEKPKPRQVREKKPDEPKVQCKCHTKKGDRCKKWCLPGHDTCKQHMEQGVNDTPSDKEPNTSKESGDGVVSKKRKTTVSGEDKPKVKKMPMHNHEPGETPSEPCYVCLAHGDVLDPDMPDDDYVCEDVDGMGLEERLRLAIEEDEKSDPGSEYEYIEEEIEVEVDEDGNEIIKK